jgi:hypothetical protein
VSKETRNRIMKITKRTQAIWPEIAETLKNPSAPAIKATTRKIKAHLNIFASPYYLEV